MNIAPEISGTQGVTFTQPPRLPRGGKMFCLRGARTQRRLVKAENSLDTAARVITQLKTGGKAEGVIFSLFFPNGSSTVSEGLVFNRFIGYK